MERPNFFMKHVDCAKRYESEIHKGMDFDLRYFVFFLLTKVATSVFDGKNEVIQEGANLKMYMKALVGEFIIMIRIELKQINERLDRMKLVMW